MTEERSPADPEKTVTPAIYLASAILLSALSVWAFGARKRMIVRTVDHITEEDIEGQVSIT
jgi:hypothetical protein